MNMNNNRVIILFSGNLLSNTQREMWGYRRENKYNESDEVDSFLFAFISLYVNNNNVPSVKLI